MRGVRRFELVLIATIVLSGPSLLGALDGAVAVTTALLRVAGALALCWAVGAIVERTLDNYARQARHKELSQRIARLRGASFDEAGGAAFPLERQGTSQFPGNGPAVH